MRVKINIDAAFNKLLGKVWMGTVIRNNKGELVLVGGSFLQTTYIVVAKALAICEALKKVVQLKLLQDEIEAILILLWM